ncbi:PAS domain-containing protein [Proteobacteria bacterium 005FR1]|nr:PAS domain-containing protein [Proteobacteria bacterium 005FR1]
MSFDLTQIALIGVGYLVVLFGIAFITEKGWLPETLVQHPLTYILSLGVFASAFAYYGVVDLAFQYGYGALAFYLGVGALFLFAPIALQPLTEIVRRYQIRSLADLLVFRYHSHAVGILATFCMVLAVIPLMGLQLQAVSDTITLLSAGDEGAWTDAAFTRREALAFAYAIMLAVFTMLFGAKREQHRGLVTALAFESLLKVCALLAIGLFAVFGVFGGMDGLDAWLLSHPENMELLHSPIRDTGSSILLLIFLSSAVAMPHIFHMSVVETPLRRSLGVVSWAVPLFLLFLALPVFPILWAGFELNAPVPAQYFSLGVPLQAKSGSLTIIAFLGGLSAATGAQVAITLALTTMIVNHWLLPALRLDARYDIYLRLLWLRRLVVLAIFLAGFLFFLLVHGHHTLVNLAILGFVAGLQFLPGIIAVAYWPRGNQRGFVAGLSIGFITWGAGLFVPALTGISEIAIPFTTELLPVGLDRWSQVTLWSFGLNAFFFVAFSLLGKASEEERYSAALCTADEISHPVRSTLDVHSASEFKSRLSTRLGREIANQEVNRALSELGLSRNERRPYALRRLRDRLEANLSGLMGVNLAGEIVGDQLPYTRPASPGNADIHWIEDRMARHQNSFTGITAELNNVRLYYRNTLQELPIAICSLGADLEILMWNKAMADLTGIDGAEVTGSHLASLPEPWHELIAEFSGAPARSQRRALEFAGEPRWFSLHKAVIRGPVPNSADGQVILVEDVTEVQLLEKELLHTERLASVGRLAAGVAHEIGNPITGIACLAQNIRYETKDPGLLETVEEILNQTSRVDRIVQSLVSFSHGGSPHLREFGAVMLRDCADEAIHLLSLQHEKTPVHFANKVPKHLQITGDSQQLIQVFVNLLANARDASEPGGHVEVAGQERGEEVLVTVTDEGEGIDPAQLDRILEPFFTTKEPGEGTGLGLSMVYSIVTEHQGELSVSSPVANGRGARFTLAFQKEAG